MLKRIAAEHLALPRERRIRIEDAKPAADHDDNGDEIHPVGDADDPVMTLSIQGQLSSWYHFFMPILYLRVRVAVRVL